MSRLIIFLLSTNFIQCQFQFNDINTFVPFEPKPGQRCAGRNYPGGRRCCTPQQPCDEGEGDCDGPDDGGQHDGHAGCKGNLVCGSNNCKKFGRYYHEKDDCCEKPSETQSESTPVFYPDTPLEPPPGAVTLSSTVNISTQVFQVRDVVDGTILAVGDAVLPNSLVTRERETVTDQETGVNMTAMPAVRETWSVALTTA